MTMATRGLRESVRSGPQSGLRVALVALLILCLLQAVAASFVIGAPGLRLFGALLGINVWFVTILGVSMFSGVLTEEKEQSTLGLLQLAGFTSVSILLGKSVGQLLTALLLLLVQVPFVMLSVTLGGVAVGQVVAGFGILLAYMVFLYTLGMLSSVVCARTRGAVGMCVALLILWWSLPAMVAELLGPTHPVGAWIDAWSGRTIFTPIGAVTETGYDAAEARPVIVAHLVAAAAVFVLSWALFDPFNRHERVASPARGMIPRGDATARSRPGPRGAAIRWKEFHFTHGGAAAVGLRCIVYGLVLFGTLIATGQFLDGLAGAVTWCLLVLILDCGLLASRLVRDEVRQRTLPGLYLFPMQVKRWLSEKRVAALVVLAPGLVATSLAMGGVLLVLPANGEVGFGLIVGGFYLFANVVLGCQVATYLSLILPRGALAAAIVAMVVMNFIFGSMSFLFGAFGIAMCAMLAIPAGMLALVPIVQRRILSKIEELAAR